VNAGGRYDGLAEALGGPATPGVGFAMGLDRVLLAMEGEDVPVPPPRTPTCFVVAIGDEAREAGGSLLGELRSEGIAAVDPLESRPLKAQLKMADRVGAEFALIVGERELADGVCTLRRLADGVQKTVPRADVVRWLTRLDGWTDGAR
jgi:histidyl-tRNA synthetase